MPKQTASTASFSFSSESVGEGHPDKVADYISDSILDACLAQDKNSRVAVETLVKNNLVVLGGELTTKAKINTEAIVRSAIKDIGYTFETDIFNASSVHIMNALSQQSPDIAQGVDAKKAKGKKTAQQGAGDQGIMFGFACKETPELMPLPIMLAHKLNKKIATLRRSKAGAFLRPDCKTQVAVRYENGKPARIENVVISTQHAAGTAHKTIEQFCKTQVIEKVLPKKLLTKQTEYFINPTGNFVIGGPEGDAGLTGRKIIVDTYGGYARHGGGAFSGKDATKVDRSAAYLCRWIAKNLVAAGLAEKAEVQLAYAIGHPQPTSVHLETFGTGTESAEVLTAAIRQVFGLKPADIVKQLGMLKPIYRSTTHYGHFGKKALPWEQTNKIAALKRAVKQLA